MFERTHGSVTRALMLACGWPWQDAQIAAIASMATDHATPSFLGETHLAEFPALGVPVPTAINTSAEQIGSSWYPGWPILARWHGGNKAYEECRPIEIGDNDWNVEQAASFAREYAEREDTIRLGMELHAAMDTATHAGFWPCWHPENRNPEYKRNCLKFWVPIIPPILHAQYLSDVDAIEGEGRGGRTRDTAICELSRLIPILLRGETDPERRLALFGCVGTARNDAHFCELLDALACEIAGRTLPPLAVWPRGNPEWREFFNVARGE